MRIGIVSDTHNHLKNARRIVELFNEAGVDRVVHTGDITQPKTLAVFADLQAPLVGVYGNNDLDERHRLEPVAAEHGFHFAEPPLHLEWHGRRLVVVHDPLELAGVPDGTHEIALHGHTHMRRIERAAGRLIFNPGECAGHMPGYNAVGVLDLETLTPGILSF